MSPVSGDAEIRDVRYTRYGGERRGRLAGVMSLARWGALRSLGARRGWKAKLIPIALAVLALGPAIIVLGVRALFADQTGIDLTEALPFSGYQGIIGVLILLFAAVTTPELLCPDRRDGTLSLYFSTAVSRREYLAGRVLAAVEDAGFRKEFGALEGERLSRVPQGFAKDHPHAELLKLKDVIFSRRLADTEVFSPTLPDAIARSFATAIPVFALLASLDA